MNSRCKDPRVRRILELTSLQVQEAVPDLAAMWIMNPVRGREAHWRLG